MAATRCLSSHMMTALLEWRNPQGAEENWWNQHQGINDIGTRAVKIVVTELGLALLTIAAVVETVALAALEPTNLILSSVFHLGRIEFHANLLQSSSFTILWGVADLLLYNPLFLNVMSKESFARYWAQMFNPTPIQLFRPVDQLYVADWERQHRQQNINDPMLAPIVAAVGAPINQGANLIIEDVLAGASAETLTLFRNSDPEIFMFVLTKAIFTYVFGGRRNEEIPNFFKDDTVEQIRLIRQNPAMTQEILDQIELALANPGQFEAGPQNQNAREVFTSLRNIAAGELQRSLFVTRCWQRAIELLPQENSAAV